MNGIFFYIGLGAGLAAACGLRPFLPVLLAGALGSSDALGVSFAHDPFRFLQSGWWLLAAAVALVLAYALQLAVRARADDRSERPQAAQRSSRRIAHRPGARRGRRCCSRARSRRTATRRGRACSVALLVAGLAQRASWPVIVRARSRLADRAAREALTVYLDAASLLLAALVALLHPLGYVAVALLAWFAWRGRARADEKYAGLRILRR